MLNINSDYINVTIIISGSPEPRSSRRIVGGELDGVLRGVGVDRHRRDRQPLSEERTSRCHRSGTKQSYSKKPDPFTI